MIATLEESKGLNMENCSSLANIKLFQSIKDDELSDINKNGIYAFYKKGQTLFVQGNNPYGVFCVINGNVKITSIGSDGKESIIKIVASGDILGHRSLFSNCKYSTTAIAIDDTEVFFFEKNYIFNLLNINRTIVDNLIKKLTSDIGLAESRLTSLQRKNVRERLAELLLTLKDTHGVKEGNYIKINIKLSREEMAEIIGTASETLIRILTEFKEAEIIEQNGKSIFIKDEEKLMNWSKNR